MSESEPIDLNAKFPEMKPINSPPSLFTWNGIGFSLYGGRDRDAETGTYVKTVCFCVVFFPVLAVSAYRVADAGYNSWYFLGRVPLSKLAKFWNKLVFGCVLSAISVGLWNNYTSSPAYQDRQRMAKAAALHEDGDRAGAAGIYFSMLHNPTHKAEARGKLQEYHEAVKAGPAQPDDVAVLAVLVKAEKRTGEKVLYPGLGRELIQRARADADPAVGMRLYELAVQIPKFDAKAVADVRDQLLVALCRKPDAEIRYVDELARRYRDAREMDKCEALLLIHRDRLGDTESARILGEAFLAKGKHAAAYPLLLAYVKGRIDELRAAEKGYEDAYRSASRAILRQLNANPHSKEYKRLERLAKEEQQRQVDIYITERIKGNPGILKALECMSEAARVVPVALDLGILQLNRAQNMKGEARVKELQEAERTFLSIGSVAAGSDEYKMSLGEVYYWLGKEEEGKKLFEDLLAGKKRSFEALIAVASRYRGLGLVAPARKLALEAFNKTNTPAEKETAATLLYLLAENADEEIVWLQKAASDGVWVKIRLNSSRGTKALGEGRLEAAERYLKEAVSGYEQQPPGVSNYNNTALCCLSLYTATGDPAWFSKGVELQHKAYRLAPSDTILLMNYASMLFREAVVLTVAEQVDLRPLRQSATFELMRFLYRDQPGREALMAGLREHPSFQKAIEANQKLLVLAPKSHAAYGLALQFLEITRDAAALKKLQTQLQQAKLDLSAVKQQTRNAYSGANDKERLENLAAYAERLDARLTANPASRNKLFHAICAVDVVTNALARAQLGAAVAPDRNVKLARSAYAAAPSSRTRSVLQEALCARAIARLAADDKELAECCRLCRNGLDAEVLMAYLLACSKWSRDLLADRDVKEYLRLEEEILKLFPRDRSVWDWAVFRNCRPELAKAAQARCAQPTFMGEYRQTSVTLAPNSPGVLMYNYLTAVMDGKLQAAQAIAVQAENEHLPFPFRPGTRP